MSKVHSCLSALNIQTCLTIITMVNAIFVAWVSYQQNRVSKAKLKHELFERRHRIYESVATYLSDFLRHGNADHNRIDKFLRETRDVQFFFKEDITSLLRTISNLSHRHDVLERQVMREKDAQAKSIQDMTKIYQEQRTIKDHLTAIGKNLSVSFGPYLDFKRWR